MTWIKACPVDDLPEGEGRQVEGTTPPVAVFNSDGEFFATADTCSHADSSLSEGYVEDGKVECVWHFASFCLRTGAAEMLPATEPIATYEVKVKADDIYVKVDPVAVSVAG